MKIKTLFALAIVLFILPGTALAAENSGTPPSSGTGATDSNDNGGVHPPFSIDFGPVLGAIEKLPSKIADAIIGKLENWISEKMVKELLGFTDIYTQKFAKSLHTNPPVGKFGEVQVILVSVILALLSFLLYFSGIRLMISADSPVKRENAKESVKNIVIIFILVLVSYWLYIGVIDFSYALNGRLSPETAVEAAYSTAWQNVSSFIVRTLGSFLFSALTLVAWLTLFVVKIMQMLGLVLFPIGVFLYFSGWEPTKQLGSSILMFLVTMTLIPILDTAIFVGVYKMGFSWALAGLFLIVVINWHACKQVFTMITGPVKETVGAVSLAAKKVTALA